MVNCTPRNCNWVHEPLFWYLQRQREQLYSNTLVCICSTLRKSRDFAFKDWLFRSRSHRQWCKYNSIGRIQHSHTHTHTHTPSHTHTHQWFIYIYIYILFYISRPIYSFLFHICHETRTIRALLYVDVTHSIYLCSTLGQLYQNMYLWIFLCALRMHVFFILIWMGSHWGGAYVSGEHMALLTSVCCICLHSWIYLLQFSADEFSLDFTSRISWPGAFLFWNTATLQEEYLV